MKTLDAVALMKKFRELDRSQKEWIEEHDIEVEDLVYEESVGKKQSWDDGSMIGAPYERGRFTG